MSVLKQVAAGKHLAGRKMFLSKTLVSVLTMLAFFGCASNFEETGIHCISTWGEGNSEIDSRAVDIIVSSSNSNSLTQMDARLYHLVQRKILENPGLLKQVVEGVMNESGGTFSSDKEQYMANVIETVSHPNQSAGTMAYHLIIFSSMFNQPEWVINTSWATIPLQWNKTKIWLNHNKNNIYWDSVNSHFVAKEVSPGLD